MGLDIATVFARTGHQVVVREISDELAAKAAARLEASLTKLVGKGKMSSEQKQAIQAAMTFTTDISLAADADLVVEAAEMAAQGLDAETIVARLNEMKERLDVSFVLQTLEYLQKGGRCSSVTALGARALQLRPEIRVSDGGMGVGKKYRGSMEKSVLDYIRGRLEGRDDVDTRRIFVTHSPMDQAVVDKAIALVRELHPFEEVIETSAGCTICSHCGPNCLGVLFFKKA